MPAINDLYQYSLLPIFLVSVFVVVAASEIGRWLGVRVSRRGGDEVSTLQAALLGLLALMIGFTFSMALLHFDGRRDAVLNEANAIGGTALRARLLPPPYRPESLKLLREYVQIRMDIIRRGPTAETLDAAMDRSNALQEALWQQAMAAAAKDNGMVPTGLYIQALNEMVDSQAKRLTAIRERVPNVVLIALYGVTAVAVAFTGYASGLEARHARLPTYLMGILVCAVILLIQDLDRPGIGFVRVSQQPMIDAAAAIAAYHDKP
jgi:hypothetical protein